MCAMIYRHGPSMPTIIGAVVTFFGGLLLTLSLHQREQSGLGSSEQVMMAVCVTIVLTGALLIAAFSRYQFTHLWKPQPHGASKKKGKPGPRKR